MSLANLLSPTPGSSSLSLPSSPMAEMDESELIAAAALGGMRTARATHSEHEARTDSRVSLVLIYIPTNASILFSGSSEATPALSLTSSTSYTTLSDAAAHPTPGARSGQLDLYDNDERDIADGEAHDADMGDDVDASGDFVSRVSRVSLVNTALRAYEHSKNSSRVVKVRPCLAVTVHVIVTDRRLCPQYGAEMVESSVKTISRPVIGRLPVGQLDDFACRQLDRVRASDCRLPLLIVPRPPLPSNLPATGCPVPFTRVMPGRLLGVSRLQWGSYTGKPSLDATPMQVDERSPSRSRDRGRTSERGRKRQRAPSAMSPSPDPGPSTRESAAGDETEQEAQARAVAVRSTWQAVLLEAGGISAAVSEESMKRLKYCLQWLQVRRASITRSVLIARSTRRHASTTGSRSCAT